MASITSTMGHPGGKLLAPRSEPALGRGRGGIYELASWMPPRVEAMLAIALLTVALLTVALLTVALLTIALLTVALLTIAWFAIAWLLPAALFLFT